MKVALFLHFQMMVLMILCLQEMTNSLVLATNSMNEVLQSIWKEIDKWNFEQKQEITALTKPVDGSLDKLDKL